MAMLKSIFRYRAENYQSHRGVAYDQRVGSWSVPSFISDTVKSNLYAYNGLGCIVYMIKLRINQHGLVGGNAQKQDGRN
ncbi:hypothetical protein YC2023_037832 [Brassica napus]